MILEIVLNSKVYKIRKRRSTSNSKTCEAHEIFCCKRSFKVRPVDLGMNFIVHPEIIDLSYCFGECNSRNFVQILMILWSSSVLDFVKSNGYRKVITLLRQSNKSNLSPLQLESMKSCCAPENYEGLQLIYMTPMNNTFQRAYLRDLLIRNCACV